MVQPLATRCLEGPLQQRQPVFELLTITGTHDFMCNNLVHATKVVVNFLLQPCCPHALLMRLDEVRKAGLDLT
jgi:hypothetical protein